MESMQEPRTNKNDENRKEVNDIVQQQFNDIILQENEKLIVKNETHKNKNNDSEIVNVIMK